MPNWDEIWLRFGMKFEKRLEKAIERGMRRGNAKVHEAEVQALSETELKRLHSGFRLQLSEHIENCVKCLPNHFPGFQLESVFGERGWGAACSRDDVGPARSGKRTNYYSRLEATVRPFSSLCVLELSAKGTIRDKEIFNRTHFEKLAEADLDNFKELIDLWVLEYVELYAVDR